MRKLFSDESGAVISAELALVLTILVLGVIVGLSEVAVAVNTELNDIRCQALITRTHQLFPELRPAGDPVFWCGLRPSTPSNVPFVGRSRVSNLYLNTGHGTLGWTMACGAGSALADIVDGREPPVRLRAM